MDGVAAGAEGVDEGGVHLGRGPCAMDEDDCGEGGHGCVVFLLVREGDRQD